MPVVTVDTVGVAFPLSERAVEAGGLGPRQRRTLPGGGFAATGIGGMVWAEASLPKRREGENVHALDLTTAVDQVRELCREAAVVCGADVSAVCSEPESGEIISIDNPKIVRLDLVRDFTLSEPSLLSQILDELSRVPQHGRLKIQRFADGRTGGVETLRVGPGSWAATLYDKCAETRGSATPGSLRAEFRLRGRQLRSVRAQRLGATVTTLVDLHEESCETLRRHWWEMVKFGSWIGGSQSIWSLLSATDLSDREKLFFVGWNQAREDGVDIEVSPKTDRRYREILRSIGRANEGIQQLRLNYETGREELSPG